MIVSMIYALMTIKNRKEFTMKCLDSLAKQTYEKLSIVVVDDGSTDGSAEAIKKKYPSVNILRGNGDLWFTGGMRKGIDYILSVCKKGDHILLLNDDTVFNKDFVQKLLDTILKEERICVGSISKSLESGEIKYLVHNRINGITTPTIIHFEKNILLESDCLNTRGTLVEANLFREIGNFSKLFPHYGSDYDLFYRAKKKGYKLLVNTEAVIYSQDDDKGLAGSLKEKGRLSVKEFYKLFFSRKSTLNLYSRILLVILYTPFPQKLLTIISIILNMIYIFFIKVIFGKNV